MDQAVAMGPGRADLDRGAFEAPARKVQPGPVQPERELRKPVAEPLDPLPSRQHVSMIPSTRTGHAGCDWLARNPPLLTLAAS